MSKSPLSMPRPGRLTSSHGDHWQSSPQAGRGDVAVEGLGWGDVAVGTGLVAGLGCVSGGPVELPAEGRRGGRRAQRQGPALSRPLR